MAYAMKRRRNAGAPKRRTQLTKMRGSASFKRGQRLAAKLIAGRRLNPKRSQKEIRQQIHALVREQGSKSDIALLEGPTGVGKAPHQFRKGLASVAADVAGFKPSRSSSRAGKTVSREFARDKRDTKRGFESASAQAMRVRAEQGVSLKEAWAIVKGESKPKRKSKSKRKSTANPRRNGTKTGMMRKTGRALPLGLKEKNTYGQARGVSVSADYFVNSATGDNFIEFNLIRFPGDMKVLGEPFEAQNEYIVFSNYDQQRGLWTFQAPHATGTMRGKTLKQLANEVALDLAAFFSGVAPDGSLIERKSNPLRNGTKTGMMRKTSRRAYKANPFGAEFLFI